MPERELRAPVELLQLSVRASERSELRDYRIHRMAGMRHSLRVESR